MRIPKKKKATDDQRGIEYTLPSSQVRISSTSAIYISLLQRFYDDKRIEFLMLGQHMAETGTNEYSFSWDKDRLFEEEYRALGEATVMGVTNEGTKRK